MDDIITDPIDSSQYYRGDKNVPKEDAQFEWTSKMVKELKKCKENIIHFAENHFWIVNLDHGKIKIELYKAQKRALKSLADNRFVCVLASRQCGKALALDTPILTKNGWSTMGKLKDGDIIYGSKGQFVEVLKAHEPLLNRNCYEVEFDNGEKIIADEQHLWFTQNRNDQRNKKKGQVRTTKEIYNTLLTHDDEPNHRIPKANGIECKECGTVIFKPLELVCKLSFKTHYYYIKKITPVKSVPVRCITVNSEDSLYLAGKQLIPTHNTTISTIYALWNTCFFDDQRVIIVANKESTAINIFKRIRMAYELLPNYLKPGVKEYGKTGVTFANGSSIGISTTTSTAARGDTASILCVRGDATVLLKDKKTGIIYEPRIEDYYYSTLV
jgi:hypothetical protein